MILLSICCLSTFIIRHVQKATLDSRLSPEADSNSNFIRRRFSRFSLSGSARYYCPIGVALSSIACKSLFTVHSLIWTPRWLSSVSVPLSTRFFERVSGKYSVFVSPERHCMSVRPTKRLVMMGRSWEEISRERRTALIDMREDRMRERARKKEFDQICSFLAMICIFAEHSLCSAHRR